MGIKSMTAYGRARINTPSGVLIIELHSVNRKTFDLASHFPKEFLCFDMEVRKLIQKKVRRGQLTLRLTKEVSPQNVQGLLPNPEFLKKLKEAWEAIAEKLSCDKGEVGLKFLTEQTSRFPSFDSSIDSPEFKENLLTGISQALSSFLEMKEAEGEYLQRDIKPRLDKISAIVSEVKELSVILPKLYREKLDQRIKDLLVEDEERIHREVVLYAEKSDITEEIVRLESHIQQFNDILGRKEESVGRTLDFVIQEMHREVNTIASKSTHLDISKHALEMKSEIEKIREQVQNIE